jgi:putative PEP-CTERM system TPR-repeat lipoprotein
MSKRFNRVITSATVLLVVMGGLAGCDHVFGVGEQELIQRAKNFKDKGDTKAAIIELKSALQKNPNSAEARWLLGQVYVLAGQGSNAEKELAQAAKLGIKEESIAASMGQALLLQQDYERVLKEVKLNPKASPKDAARILQVQGEAQLGLGRVEQGCDLYKQARQFDPGYVPVYWGLARCNVVEKDFVRAKSQLEQAVKLEPKNATSWILLGNLANSRADFAAAEGAYTSALKVDPNNSAAHLNRASLYLNLGKLDAAQIEVSAAKKADPSNPAAIYMQALVSFRQAKYTEARDSLQEVLRIAPKHMPSILLFGAVAYELGSYEQAEKYATNFLEQNPDSVYARKMLVATQLKSDQLTRAQETLKPLLSQEKPDAQTLALEGEVSLKTRDYVKAKEFFEKAIELDPKNTALRTQLGTIRLASGDSAGAIGDFEKAASQDPSSFGADTILIQTFLGKKEWDKAFQAIAALEKKQPKNPITFDLKGAAYVGKNDFANARKSFEQALALQPTHITAVMSLAQLDLKDKLPEAARKRFEDVLAKDKNNMQAMLALANIAAGSGKELEYVSWLEKAAKANPSALQPLALLANYYVQKKEPQKALRIARDAQTANPQNPDSLDLLGSVQFAADEKENALATYRKLVQLVPKSPVAHYKLASMQATVKDAAAARISFNKALELKPDYLEAQTALILLEMESGKPVEAVRIAQNIQSQSPKSPMGFALEGDVLMAQKKYPEAKSAYEKALAIGKNGLFAVKVHQAQSLAGDVKGADAGLLQWLKEYPDDVAVRGHLAQTYMQAGRNKQAIEQYEFILQKSPNSVPVLNNLAFLYQQEKSPRALPIAEQAYKLRPDVAESADTLGWILVEQGKVARGVEVLQKAAAAAPKDPEIGYHYAVALVKSGDKAKARKQLEALLATGQKFPQMEQAKVLLKQL